MGLALANHADAFARMLNQSKLSRLLAHLILVPAQKARSCGERVPVIEGVRQVTDVCMPSCCAQPSLDSDGWESGKTPLPHPLSIEPNGRRRIYLIIQMQGDFQITAMLPQELLGLVQRCILS
jgi:hypothetical protein